MCGRLAQLARAPRLHRGGRGFEPLSAHHMQEVYFCTQTIQAYNQIRMSLYRKINRRITRLLYKYIAKPLLFRLSPDNAHRYIVTIGSQLQRWRLFRFAISSNWAHPAHHLERTICGITFKNPIGISAGFDKNGQLVPLIARIGCGFTTVGSITAMPRTGNPKPWFYRLPKTKSLVVHAGLPNEGVDSVVSRLSKNAPSIPIIVSVAVVTSNPTDNLQTAVDDATSAISHIILHNVADIIELNISCPNANDNQPFICTPALADLLQQIDSMYYSIPLFVKMPLLPWEEFEPLLDIIRKHAISGVTIANLVKDRTDVQLQDKLSNSMKGGLSGLPTKQLSTELIRKTRKKCGNTLAIIGVGGIFTAADAKEKLDAGADLVALITGLIFEGPQLIGDIVADLDNQAR